MKKWNLEYSRAKILQNSKKNLEGPPILAPKLRILRTGYIRAAKFQVFFGMNIYLSGYVGAYTKGRFDSPSRKKWIKW